MYITDKIYRILVETGVACIKKGREGCDDPFVRDLETDAPVRFRPSFLEAIDTYRLDIVKVAFGNVFIKCRKGSRVNGY